MSLDELPDQFKEFVERARAALGREITAAKNIIASGLLKRLQRRPRLPISAADRRPSY